MSIASVFSVPVVSTSPAGRGTRPPTGPTALEGVDDGDGGDSGGTVVGQQGAFVTPASLASFAGATFAVTTMWRVSGVIVPGWDHKPLVGLAAAAIVGIVLYLISELSPNRGPVTSSDRLVAVFVGFINTLVIFSAAMGAGGAIGLAGT